jgi:hypothetical protein
MVLPKLKGKEKEQKVNEEIRLAEQDPIDGDNPNHWNFFNEAYATADPDWLNANVNHMHYSYHTSMSHFAVGRALFNPINKEGETMSPKFRDDTHLPALTMAGEVEPMLKPISAALGWGDTMTKEDELWATAKCEFCWRLGVHEVQVIDFILNRLIFERHV